MDEKFYISKDKVQRFLTNLNNKDALLYDACQVKREGRSREYNDFCPTLTSRDYKDPRLVNDNVVKQVGSISKREGNWNNPQVGRIYSTNGCRPTLNTCGGGSHEPKIVQLGNVNPSGNGMNGNIYGVDGISPTLTTNKGEGFKCLIDDAYLGFNPIPRVYENHSPTLSASHFGLKVSIKQATKKGYVECEVGGVADLSYPDSKTRRGRVQEGGKICPTLTATETGVCRIESDIRIRKLTPKECWRLMGFDDKSFKAAEQVNSNSQLYKQAGNSIVVDVLYYIFVELYKAMPYLFDDLKLSSFFSGIGAFEVALDRLYRTINEEEYGRKE